MDTRPSYRSFLLRLWRRKGDKAGPYVLLEDPLTGERVGFSSLRALMMHLQHIYDELLAGSEPTDESNETQET